MGELRPLMDGLATAGVPLAFIGCGRPDQAAAFAEAEGLAGRAGVHVLTDPDGRAQAALGLRHGILPLLSPRSVLEAFRAWRHGYRQSAVAGDPWQFGGAAVMAKGGEALHVHVARTLGDHVPPLSVRQVLARTGVMLGA